MKKLKKILIIACIFILAICHLNNTFAYTLEEAKKLIDYKTVKEDGKPSKYDVLIDLSELKDNEEWPCGIRSQVDNLIFDSDKNLKLKDIDFFNTKTSNTDAWWLKIRDFVKTYYHIALYIAVALMMTLLIFIGVVIVLSSISDKTMKIPFINTDNGKENNTKISIKSKKLIEEWIKCFFLIVLMVYIINVIIAFSGIMYDVVNTKQTKKDNGNYITVYVANLNGEKNPKASDIDTTDAYYFKTNLEGLMMFQTQYKEGLLNLKNVANYIAVATLTVFKVFLELLFVVRMLAVTILTILAPIIVIANSFTVIAGNKGFLNKWFKLYLYFVFLKPAIALAYYILVRTNPYLVAEHPMYVLFIILVIIILFAFSAKAMYRNFRKKNNEQVKE